MTRISAVLFLLVLIAGVHLSCTEIKSQSSVQKEDLAEKWIMSDSLANYLDKFSVKFEEGLNERRIPGASVVMVKDGRIIFEQGFGVRENGKPYKVDEHTVFRLASVSKGFASVLAGLMVEEGLLSWSEPVTDYFTDFKLNDPEQTDRVQVKHILSHTSGLPRHAYTNLVEDGLSLERIINRLEGVPLIAREGEMLAYQNAAYSVIEKVLEAQGDTTFNALLDTKLFQQLEMFNASSTHDDISESDNKAMPHVYHSRKRGRVPIPISEKYYNAVSSGGINASASDMGKWMLLLTGEYPEIISEKTLNEIFEPLTTMNNKRFSRYWDGVNKSNYAMGWRVLDNDGQRIVYHGGYVNGYRSEIALAPDDNLGICILTNANSSYPLEVIPDFFYHFRKDSTLD